MPPRYAYWTILAGGLPTAFRAADRDDLLPTFRRIQDKHPDAEMKYFARGRLWASPEDARRAAEAQRSVRRPTNARGPDWRPGGDHRDPRQKFKDAKKARNLKQRTERFERRQHPRRPGPFEPGSEAGPKGPALRQSPDGAPQEKPHGDPLRRHVRPPRTSPRGARTPPNEARARREKHRGRRS